MESFSMTAGFLTRRLAVLAVLAAGSMLAACGGNDDPKDKKANANQASLRAINLSADVPSVDVYTGDTRRFSSLTADAVSATATFDAGTTTLVVKSAGQAANLFSESLTTAKGSDYTTVIAGRESALLVRTFGESEDAAAIAAGSFRLRVLNLVSDNAAVDVHVVPAGAGITSNPRFRFTSNTLSDFQIFSSATAYRVVVTGQGTLDEVRLDIPLAGTVDKQFHTLVIVSGANGALVNASLIAQGGSATALKNTHSRVRLAAGADDHGNVSASVAGAAISPTLRSPNVSPYRLIDAGVRTLAVSVDGTVVSSGSRDFKAGSDYTVVTYGHGGAAQVQVKEDDNRAPSAATQARIRLINAVDGSQAMNLRADLQNLVSSVVPGAASGYATVAGTTSSSVEVTTPAGSLFTKTSPGSQPLLLPQGVYTLFMLGGNPTPEGQLIKDR
jgi:hypothetical protein